MLWLIDFGFGLIKDEAAMLSDEEENKECMARVCRLCYLPEEGLLRALTSKTIEVGPRKEKTTIKLKDHQVLHSTIQQVELKRSPGVVQNMVCRN